MPCPRQLINPTALTPEASVPISQELSVVNGATDFPCERSSVGSFEKVSDGVKAVKEFKQPCNRVAGFGQLVGESRLWDRTVSRLTLGVSSLGCSFRGKTEQLSLQSRTAGRFISGECRGWQVNAHL